MLNVDKIYMIHFKPLVERKKRVLNEIKFDLKWIEDEPSEKYWTDSYEDWDRKKRISCHPKATPHRGLRKSEISLAHKHVVVLKDIASNNYNISLILEDDAILHDPSGNFDQKKWEDKFNSFLDQTPNDWDVIFPGSGCGLRVDWEPVTSDKVAYKKAQPSGKCTDSYIIKKSAAEKIVSTGDLFTLPMDWELSYHMSRTKGHNLNVYWWEPPLFKQGSQGPGGPRRSI